MVSNEYPSFSVIVPHQDDILSMIPPSLQTPQASHRVQYLQYLHISQFLFLVISQGHFEHSEQNWQYEQYLQGEEIASTFESSNRKDNTNNKHTTKMRDFILYQENSHKNQSEFEQDTLDPKKKQIKTKQQVKKIKG